MDLLIKSCAISGCDNPILRKGQAHPEIGVICADCAEAIKEEEKEEVEQYQAKSA
uniref:Uncharacterized protein n=1 Tax=viral metagenome TaxID=1070528 RepID=A0A6H2A185_9ZZZZ